MEGARAVGGRASGSSREAADGSRGAGPAAGAYYIIADARERAVIPWLPGSVVSQINTGDYLVCYREGLGVPALLACVERKTYEDLAASIRDNRYANLAEMLSLRGRTGCQLYLLLEGPAHPSGKSRYGGLPWTQLESVVADLLTQCGIRVLSALDPKQSAEKLRVLLGSFARFGAGAGSESAAARLPPVVAPAPLEAARTTRALARPEALAVDKGSIPAGMAARHPRSAENSAVLMWAGLRGVSAILGRILVRKFSLVQLARQEVEEARLRALRTATGRPINKEALASLLGVRRGSEDHAVRVVMGLRGLTPPGATAVLRHFRGLRRLCEASASEIAAVELPHPAGSTQLGKKKATQLFEMLHHRTMEPGLSEEVFGAGAVPPSEDPADPAQWFARQSGERAHCPGCNCESGSGPGLGARSGGLSRGAPASPPPPPPPPAAPQLSDEELLALFEL